MNNRVIVADLCEQGHRFFYYRDDRNPCPYCRIDFLTTEGERKDETLAAIKRYTLAAQEMASGQVMAPLSSILLAIDGRIVEDAPTEPNSFTSNELRDAVQTRQNDE